MDASSWINRSQPQTLTSACILLYINAAFGLLALGAVWRAATNPGLLSALSAVFVLLVVVGGVMAARGLAAQRWWGYYLALVVAVAPFAFRVAVSGNLLAAFGDGLLNLIFQVILVVLLVHNQTRDYAKLWFR